MRVEPYGVGSVVHVVKRGARGMEIVRDEPDRWRFVRLLYILNDAHRDRNLARIDGEQRSRSDLHQNNPDDAGLTCLPNHSPFGRPDHWPERDPLVSILAWTLMPNHLHLLLRERREGGISKFMQRLCGSMSMAFNEKYAEKGSLFQGSFRGRTVDTDEYLRYVLAYIVVKNVFELHPKGLKSAIGDFESTWKWAASYPFSSFRTAAHDDRSPIIDHGSLVDLGLQSQPFKQNAFDMLVGHIQTRPDIAAMILEDW